MLWLSVVRGFFSVCLFFAFSLGDMISSIWEEFYQLASSPVLAALILQLFGFLNSTVVCHNDQNTCDSSFKRSILHLAVSCGQETHSDGNQSGSTDQKRRQGKVCLQALSFFFLYIGTVDKSGFSHA